MHPSSPELMLVLLMAVLVMLLLACWLAWCVPAGDSGALH